MAVFEDGVVYEVIHACGERMYEFDAGSCQWSACEFQMLQVVFVVSHL